MPGWWFPKDDLDAESIAFEMLLGGAVETSYAARSELSAWFEFRGVDRYEVQEQAFLLPNERVPDRLDHPRGGSGLSMT